MWAKSRPGLEEDAPGASRPTPSGFVGFLGFPGALEQPQTETSPVHWAIVPISVAVVDREHLGPPSRPVIGKGAGAQRRT